MAASNTTYSVMNTDRVPLRQRNDGVWQLRKRIQNGKRIEVSLGTKNRALAEERAAQIVGHHSSAVLLESWAAKITEGNKRGGWLRALAGNIAHRAKRKGGAAIPIETLRHIAERSGGRCEVSGMPFYFGAEKRHFRQPSIDRIDSARGYELDNLRLVCLAVNYCMSQWGERVFHAVAAAVVARQLQTMSTVDSSSAETGDRNRAKKGTPES